MKTNRKHGFTVVELVVVIAIIAVLAAVLIPTFLSVIKRANISKDTQLIRNLNTSLVADSAKNGKHTTMQSALDAAEQFGYDVAKINASATDNEILWDSKNDVFCYFNADSADTNKIEYIPEFPGTEGADPVDYFIISKDIDDNYSTYYTGTAATITTDKGFDAGKSSVASITYDRSSATEGQTVVIRTNGGTLTVNAPADTVKHYGEAAVLNIEAVDTENCYREFGTVANAQIKKGKIVIESAEAKVENLLLVAKADKSGFEKIVVEIKAGAELPVFDRTDVDIAANGTLVLNLVTPSTNEYIYLTKVGVIEQIVITNEVKDDVSNETANVASKSAATQAVAEQIANVGKKNDDGKYVDSNGNVIALESLTSENIVIKEKKADDVAITLGTTKFAGGAGTEKSPYLIATLEHWNNLAIDSKGDNKFANSDKYFAVISDLVFDADFKTVGNFSGHIDFQNHSITCTEDMPEFNLIDYSNNHTSIENLNIYNYRPNFTILYANNNNISFNNVNIYGNHLVTYNNQGLFIAYPALYQTSDVYISLENCNVYSTITATSTFAGVFLGTFNSYSGTDKTVNLIMKDCTYYGNFTASDSVAMIVSNPTSFGFTGAADVKIYLKNVKNEGTIKGANRAGLVMSRAAQGGYYEYVKGDDTRGKIYFYSDESLQDEYLIVDNLNERVKLSADNTPSVLDVKNVGNGVTTTSAYAKLVVDQDKKIQLYNVISNNATKYVVSFGFSGVWGIYHGGTFAYNIEIPADQIDNVEIFAYEWVNANTYGDAKALPAPGLTTHDVVYGDVTLKVDSENHYVFSEKDAVIRSQPKITVFAFDSNNNVINIGTEDGTVVIQENLPIYELILTWKSAMPIPSTIPVGNNWDSFYAGADGFSCSSNAVGYDSKRQYTLKISEMYNNDPEFKLRVVFFNSDTGLVTEVLDGGNAGLTGGRYIPAGGTWTFAPTLSTSDRFYVTGYCGNPGKHNGDKAAHDNCVSRFQSNITIISEKIPTN